MVYLLIAIVLCSILISILKLKPSKHEKMLSRLRTKAMGDGLTVKVVWLKELEWMDGVSTPDQFVAYQCARESRQEQWHCVPTGDDSKRWLLEGNPGANDIEPIRLLKQALGEKLIAIERRPTSVIVYWQEQDELYPHVRQYLLQK